MIHINLIISISYPGPQRSPLNETVTLYNIGENTLHVCLFNVFVNKMGTP